MNESQQLLAQDTEATFDPLRGTIVEVGDDTPTLQEQARISGWKAGVFDFGRAERPGEVDHFNPGLIRRQDGLWLLVRRSELVDGMIYGRNGIWACKLEEDLTPKGGPLLAFPDSAPEEQFEDPRAVYWNDQTWVGCVNFTWFQDGSWTGAHQMLGIFRNDEEWTAIARRDPPVETNKGTAGFTDGNHQKNWIWWFIEGRLHLLYTSDPWKVIEFGNAWEEQRPHVSEGIHWQYGQIRGGTPPVLVGEHYITFFHSSLPWRGRYRRYYMGAIAFAAKPPFAPILITPEPMLIGSQNDPWQQRKPLVVFPCGALLEKDIWTITYGINDLKCGWAKIPHEDVANLLKPIPKPSGVMLLAEATKLPETKHIPFVLNPAWEAAPYELNPATMQIERREVPFVPVFEENGGDATNAGQAHSPGAVDAAPSSNPNGAAEIAAALTKSLGEIKQKRQAAMAHARAVRAENIRLGVKPKKRRKKRSNRLTKRQMGRKHATDAYGVGSDHSPKSIQGSK